MEQEMNYLEKLYRFEGADVRIIMVEETPWFVGKDVAKILGYKDTINALKSHVDDEDKLGWRITTSGQNRKVTIINESGLYSLIISSKLPKAKEFKHWITSTVLPSIRKNGGYIVNQENMDNEQILANAVLLAQNVIKEKDKKIAELEPKAESYDVLIDAKGALPWEQVAKMLDIKGFGRNKLLELLRKKGILQENNIPYQKYRDKYFRVKESNYKGEYGFNHINATTLVKPKGIEMIRKLVTMEGLYEVVEKPKAKRGRPRKVAAYA